MIDNSFWTCPPDREVNGWGEYTITIVHHRSRRPRIAARWDPWHFDTVQMSAFHVRHTEDYTSLMEEIWRFED